MLKTNHPKVSAVLLRSNRGRAFFVILAVLLLGFGVASPGSALPPPFAGTLTVGSASAAAGSNIDLDVSLSSGAGNVCTLQFDLQFSSTLSYVATATGAASAAASKSASGSGISGGVRVLVFNLNRNVIGAGSIATVTVAIASGAPAGAIPVAITNITASDPDGLSLPLSGVNGGVTVLPPADTTPPVISGVGSAGITSSAATVSWTTNEASDSQVDYGTTSSYGSSTTVNSSPITSHSQALSGLSPNTTYHYRVKSRDAAGNLATSGDYTFVTAPPPDTTPPTISGVSSTAITSSGATITWTTNEASDSQVDYGTTTAYGSSSALDASMTTSHTRALSGLSASTTYHFRVKSRDAAGNLATSGDFSFKTADPPDTTPPVISGVGSSGITSSGATITWSTNETSDSQVDYGTTASYGSSSALDANLVTSHTRALSGLAASTTYHFRVKSRDAAGNLATSGDFTFKTADPPDTTPPTISGVATSGISSSSATISWTTNEAADTQVDYGTTASYGYSSALDATMTTSHGRALSGLTAGTTYHFRVKSRDAAGNLATSGDFTFKSLDPPDTTPPVISGVSSSGLTTSGATINWTTNENSDSQVDYGTTTSYGSSTALDASMVTAHARILSGLTAGTVYHFRVRSRDAAGNLAITGDYSFQTAEPNDTTPPVISGITSSSIASAGATITWTTNEASDSQIDFGPSASYGTSTVLNAGMVTAHSQSLSGLTPSTTYHFRVKSKDASGNLAISSDQTFTTADLTDTTPPSITGITILNVTSSGATITWTTDETADSQVEFGPTTSYGFFTLLDTNKVLAHAQMLNGLLPSTAYHLRVLSRDAFGNLGTSGDFTFTTSSPVDTTPPAITSVTVSNIGLSGATISWSTNEATDGRIEYGLTDSYGNSTLLDTNLRTSHTLALVDLSESSTYHFRVISRDAAGNVAVSNDSTFTTSDPLDVTPPVILDVTVTKLTSSSATVTWSTNEAATSQIEYGTTAAYGSSTTLDANMVTIRAKSLNGLLAHTTYHFRVSSRDAAGNLAVSDDFTFTTAEQSDTTPPVISGVTSIDVTNSAATITWTTNEAADTMVQYGASSDYGSATTLDAEMRTSHAQTLVGLTAATVYHFRVISKDADGNVAVSDDFAFTTTDTPDTTAPVISAVASSDITSAGATITWITNKAADSQVEYGIMSWYGSSTALDGNLVTSHTLKLDGLAWRTLYHFRVISRDAAGNLSASEDFTFTTGDPSDTTAPVITDVISAGITPFSVMVTWSTSEPADSQLVYGTTTDYGTWTFLDPSRTAWHAQLLSGLFGSTTYHYRVLSRDAAGNVAISDDFTFVTAEAPDTTPPIITQVASSGITSSGATITWTTSENCDTLVEYGITTSYGNSATASGGMTTSHSIRLHGLAALTTYHFRVLSTDAAGNLATSDDFTLTTTAPAVMKLAYPRLANTTGETATTADGILLDKTEYTGITVTNLGNSEAVLTFTAYLQNGDVLQGDGITNPAQRNLAAGAQLSILGLDLFGSLLSDHSTIGWIEIESSVENVTGVALISDASLKALDGTIISDNLPIQSLLTEVEGKGFTSLHVANPNPRTANVAFTLWSAYGVPLAVVYRQIESQSALAESIASLFPGITAEADNYIQVASDAGVAVLEMVGKPDQDFAGLNAINMATASSTVYSPHFAVGGSARSSLSIANLDGEDGKVTLWMFADDGRQVGPTRVMGIAGNGKVFIDDPAFFGNYGSETVTGYVVIKSNGPRLVGNVLFGDENGSATALPLVAFMPDSMLFNHLVWNETYSMSLSLLNPNTTTATATIDLYNEYGTREHSVSVAIPARQRIVNDLTAFFPELEGQNRTTGYIRVTTDKGIAGFATIATRDMRSISALPAQPVIKK